MSAAHVRRGGGSGRPKPRKAAPKVSVPKKIAKRLPVDQARANKFAGLVFAATNVPAVNDAVVRDANARGVLVNRADASDELPGDFSTPAVHRDGAVHLASQHQGGPSPGVEG